ncbi:MAG: tetratricopeptide repeat protein [Deltaproteobacteria bacterium]|nr:tetratricopeptide repeat protein [Deltaproteobacteria bacterium]
MVYRDVAKKLDLGTVVPLGKPKLKNIAERFAVYALLAEAPKGLGQILRVQRLTLRQQRRTLQWSALFLGLVVLGVGIVKNWPFLVLFLGVVYLYRDRNYEQALAEVKRSIAISPNWFPGHTVLGLILNMMGQPTETLALGEAVLRLSPRSHLMFLSHVGNAHRLLRQYEAAIVTYKRVLSAMPYNPGAHLGLATVYGELGRDEEAQAELAAAQLILPLSLETVERVFPYRDPAEVERHLAALRKAGLK